MDNETKTLLLVIAAVAGGALIGWCIRQDMRRPRSAGATAAKATAPSSDGPAFTAVDAVNPGGGCGCRS